MLLRKNTEIIIKRMVVSDRKTKQPTLLTSTVQVFIESEAPRLGVKEYFTLTSSNVKAWMEHPKRGIVSLENLNG